jgi:hypothetical protein
VPPHAEPVDDDDADADAAADDDDADDADDAAPGLIFFWRADLAKIYFLCIDSRQFGKTTQQEMTAVRSRVGAHTRSHPCENAVVVVSGPPPSWRSWSSSP